MARQVIVREAQDKFEAIIIANGIAEIGGDVFAVIYKEPKPQGPWAGVPGEPEAPYEVWAKIEDIEPEHIDANIKAKFREIDLL